MSKILSVYYYLNIAFGLFTTPYNASSGNFNLHQWPIIIYCVLFQVITIIWQFYANYLYINQENQGSNLVALNVLDMIITILSCFTYIVCILKSWLERERVVEVLKEFIFLYQNYLPEKITKYLRNIRKQLLCKIISLIFQIIVFIMDNADRFNAKSLQCEVMTCNVNYFISCAFFSLMEWYYILVDLNIYMALVFIYMCLQMLKDLLENIKNIIIFTATNVSNNEHNIVKFRKKINHNIIILIQIENKLKNLIEKLLKICQQQLLLTIMTSFLCVIFAISFFIYNIKYIIENINDHGDNVIIHTIYDILIIFMSMSNIILLFTITDCIINMFKDLSQIIYEIFLNDTHKLIDNVMAKNVS